jgi:hypothetical protein
MASHHPDTCTEYYCDCNSDFAEGLPCGHFFCSRHIADWLLDYECCPECRSHCTYFEVFNFEGPGVSQSSEELEGSNTDRDYHEDASLTLRSLDHLHISHEHRQPPGETTHDDGPCTVCMEPVGTNGESMRTICGHIFCSQCLLEALTRDPRCPNCRLFCIFSACIPTSRPDPTVSSCDVKNDHDVDVRIQIYHSLSNAKQSEQNRLDTQITENARLRDDNVGNAKYGIYHRVVLMLCQKGDELERQAGPIRRFVESILGGTSTSLALAEERLRRESSYWDEVLRTLWDGGD